jgi:hypothetical protein
MNPRVNKSMGFPAQLSNHQQFNQDPERRVQLATLEILIQLLAKVDGKNTSEYLQRVLTNVSKLIFRHNRMKERGAERGRVL